jgi:hypothetical protein
LTGEGARIAGNEADVVTKVVVDPEVDSMGIDPWQTVAASMQREELLHAGDDLGSAKEGGYCKLLKAIGAFNPITSAVITEISFRL